MKEKSFMRSKRKAQIVFFIGLFFGVMMSGFIISPLIFPQHLAWAEGTGYESFPDAQPPNVNLEVPVGGRPAVTGFADYIQLIYAFGISAIGIVATIMIMWGGFKWIAAGGNTSKIGDAKDTIYNAIIGLILALLSYTLLYVINPELVNIQNAKIKAVPKIEQKPTDSSLLAQLPKCIDVVKSPDACYSTNCGEACQYDDGKGGSKTCKGSFCKEGKECGTTGDGGNACMKPECAKISTECATNNAGNQALIINCLCEYYNSTGQNGCSSIDPCEVGVQQNCQTQSFIRSNTSKLFCVGKEAATLLCNGKGDRQTCDDKPKRTCQGGQCKICVEEGGFCATGPDDCCEGYTCDGGKCKNLSGRGF